MENENIVEAIEDRLTEKDYNFDNVDRNVDNDFTAELDKLIEAVNNGEKVEDLDLQPLVEAGYTEKYDLTEAVQNIDNFAEEIKALEDSSSERIENGLDGGDYAGFEFSENLAIEDSLYNDVKDTVMTREEGIEAALEAGVDIKELAEITSESEVIEAARAVENLEVLDSYSIESQAQDRMIELLSEEAKEYGVEINLDNLDISSELADFKASQDIDMDNIINDLNLEGVQAFDMGNGNQEVIIDTDKISESELVEAVAASLYEDNKEALQERVNNGETFEETHDNRVELSEGKSDTQEINVEGDHATVKEQTMAGEESERVIDRETGLNEMDRAAGQDSDKVETREEHIERDEHLSVEEKEAKLVEIAETTKDPEVLDRLADTDSDKVIEAVKENEHTSAETLDKIESKEESHEKSQGLSH